MVEITITVVEDSATPMFKQLPPEALKAIDNVLGRAAFHVKGIAKLLVPVDTGRLRDSIHSKKERFLRWIVHDGVYYGLFVEFGTSRQRPQPFMRPALDSIVPFLKIEIALIINALAKKPRKA